MLKIQRESCHTKCTRKVFLVGSDGTTGGETHESTLSSPRLITETFSTAMNTSRNALIYTRHDRLLSNLRFFSLVPLRRKLPCCPSE